MTIGPFLVETRRMLYNYNRLKLYRSNIQLKEDESDFSTVVRILYLRGGTLIPGSTLYQPLSSITDQLMNCSSIDTRRCS